MINIVLQAIKITEFDDNDINLAESNDDETWQVVDAAAGLLQDIALIVGDEVWNLTWEFFKS